MMRGVSVVRVARMVTWSSSLQSVRNASLPVRERPVTSGTRQPDWCGLEPLMPRHQGVPGHLPQPRARRPGTGQAESLVSRAGRLPARPVRRRWREAELCALANALTVARLRGLLATGCIVMLQSDSVSALAIIRCKIADVGDRPVLGGLAVAAARRVKLTQLHVAAIAVISEIVAALKLSLVTRHVRGHRPGPGRQWVNGEVDRIARTTMRDRRQQLAEGAPVIRP